VTPLDYDFLRKSLKERSGLVLSADKQYLAESRLLPVARKAGLGTLSELVAVLKRGNAEALMTAVVEAMMTNESLFFRDKVPFEHFRSTILPALKAGRRTSRTMRIWCAAAATGQEPYSLAICLKEMERDIAGIYKEVLNLDKVGVDDNFFDLGGNSLRLAEAHSRLQKLVDRRFSVAELFAHTTVRKLAASFNNTGLQEDSGKELLSRAQRQRQAIGAGRNRRRFDGRAQSDVCS